MPYPHDKHHQQLHHHFQHQHLHTPQFHTLNTNTNFQIPQPIIQHGKHKKTNVFTHHNTLLHLFVTKNKHTGQDRACQSKPIKKNAHKQTHAWTPTNLHSTRNAESSQKKTLNLQQLLQHFLMNSLQLLVFYAFYAYQLHAPLSLLSEPEKPQKIHYSIL
jgi:hypothetical protein